MLGQHLDDSIHRLLNEDQNKAPNRTAASEVLALRFYFGDGPAGRKLVSTLRRWVSVCLKHGFQSSEPRDLIYALLNISSDSMDASGRLKIEPNYEKPMLDLYFETIVAIGFKAMYTEEGEYTAYPYSMELARKLGVVLGDMRDVEQQAAKFGMRTILEDGAYRFLPLNTQPSPQSEESEKLG